RQHRRRENIQYVIQQLITDIDGGRQGNEFI
ncbi:hypothetical protein D027_4242B, partial [Vibrio parahaemolyticus 861]